MVKFYIVWKYSRDYFLKYFSLKIYQNNFFILKKLFIILTNQNNSKLKKTTI